MTKSGLKYHMTDRDRHGNTRHYVRVPGFGKMRIRAEYLAADGTIRADFMEAYQAALTSLREGRGSAGKPKLLTRPGTFHWLCEKYMMSPVFAAYDVKTKAVKRGILTKFCATAGDLPYVAFRRSDLVRSRDKRLATPGAADNLVKTISRLFTWAIDEDLATINPAVGVKRIFNSGGHHTWTDSEIEQFRAHHPLGTRERLALELLLNVGARRGDAVILGRQHLDGDWLSFRPGKRTNGARTSVQVKILGEFRAALDATECGDLTFITTSHRQPFTVASFGNWFRDACDAARLNHCSAHGLRKSAAVALAENGATAPELCAIFGWSNLETAMIYIRMAEKQRMAANAFARLEDYRSRKSVPLSKPKKQKWDNKGEKP